MKRKINRVGINTMTVSLPSTWVKERGIKAGDEIDMSVTDNSLVIGLPLKNNKEKIELNVDELDRTSVLMAIRWAYRAGYEEISIKLGKQYVTHYRINEKIKILTIIHEEVNRLIGAEIIMENEQVCIIKDFSSTSSEEFDPTVRRIFLLLLSASQDFVNGITKNDSFLISSMEEKHSTISKFISYCIRIINRGGVTDQSKSIALYHILASLDNVMNVYRAAARDFLEIMLAKSTKNSIMVITQMNQCLRIFYELFYKFNNKKAAEFISSRNIIKRQLINERSRFSKEELILLNFMTTLLELIWDLTLCVRSAQDANKSFESNSKT